MQDTLAAAATGNCYSGGLRKVSGHTRLYRRGAVYYHRAVVPADIVESYGKREELISLRTKDRAEALRRVRIKAVEVDNRFELHRRQLSDRASAPVLDDLTPEQMRAIQAIYHAHLLEEDEQVRIEGLFEEGDPLPEMPVPSFDEWGELATEFSEDAKRLRARFKSDVFFDDEAEEVLSWSDVNLKVRPGSTGFKKVVAAIQAAIIQAADDVLRRHDGDYVPTPEPDPTDKMLATPLMSVAVEAWVREKTRESWSPTTEQEHRTWTSAFIETCGDRQIHEYTKEEARRFKAILLQLPANWKKKAAIRNLKITDAAVRASELGLPPMSATNINKVLRFVGSFWRWAEGNYDDAPKGLFAGLSLSMRRHRARDERNPFTLDDLQRIFRAPLFTGCQSLRFRSTPGSLIPRDSGLFWTPLIGLYTGARSNEILQLHVDDVRKVHGVLCLSINDEGEDKSLKTKNAYRDIPIHQDLIRLGLLDHVEMRRREGGLRLFSDMKKGSKGNYSNPFSKQFSRLLDEVGITTPKTAFHSLRHNFEDFCRASRISSDVIQILQGRAQAGERDRYGYGEAFMKAMNEAVQSIEFAGIDLTHLHVTSEATKNVP